MFQYLLQIIYYKLYLASSKEATRVKMQEISIKQIVKIKDRTKILSVLQSIAKYIELCSMKTIVLHCKIINQAIIYYSKIMSKKLSRTEFQDSLNLVLKALSRRKQQIRIQGFVYFDLLIQRIMKILQKIQIQKVIDQTLINPNDEQSKLFMEFISRQLNERAQISSKLQMYLKKIKQNKIIPTNNNCIGCCKSPINPKTKICKYFTTIYQKSHIPTKGQYFKVVNYVGNAEVEEDIRESMCATLNVGGGYIFINGSRESAIIGIQYSNQKIQEINKFIKDAKQTIYPKQSTSIRHFNVETMLVYDNPFDASKQHKFHQFSQKQQHCNSNKIQGIGLKFIIRIQLYSMQQNLFYVCRKISLNKNAYSFFIPGKQSIGKIQEQNIYSLMTLKFYQSKINNRYITLPCVTCLPRVSSQTKKKLEDLVASKEEAVQVNTNKQLKYNTLIVISSMKFEEEFIAKIKIELTNRKILHNLYKPFSKFKLGTLRSIWLVAHQCSFEVINTIIKQADTYQKVYGLSTTRFIQLKDNIEIQKRQRFEIVFSQFFKYKIQAYFRQKPVGQTNKKSKMSILYEFKSSMQAIFGFIYLDGYSIRCEFIKQTQFQLFK